VYFLSANFSLTIERHLDRMPHGQNLWNQTSIFHCYLEKGNNNQNHPLNSAMSRKKLPKMCLEILNRYAAQVAAALGCTVEQVHGIALGQRRLYHDGRARCLSHNSMGFLISGRDLIPCQAFSYNVRKCNDPIVRQFSLCAPSEKNASGECVCPNSSLLTFVANRCIDFDFESERNLEFPTTVMVG